jgi:hypothetical protein
LSKYTREFGSDETGNSSKVGKIARSAKFRRFSFSKV